MKRVCLLALFLALIVPSTVLSDTIYVDITNVVGPWDGTQQYPFQTIQEGIDVAIALDTVLVLPGTYYENIDYLGKSITVTSDSGPYGTVINGDQSGSVVSFVNGEDADAVIDGFTITNGSGTYVDGSPPLYNGSGIYCFQSSPTIINNLITDNVSTADGMGGGICCRDHAMPLIKNNTIVSNLIRSIETADYLYGGGGGICCMLNSDATITENTIVGNAAAYAGGGVFCLNTASPTITNNYISQNFSGFAYGGGVFCKTNSAPLIQGNVISYNHTDQWGGGVYAWKSTPSIIGNYIYGNTADNGGGIYLYDNSHSLVQGNQIWNNTVVYDGAGIFCANTSSPQILDTAIYENIGGGIYCFSGSSPEIVNCLIHDNTADQGAGIYCTGGSSPTITNCTITDNEAEFLGGGLFTSFNGSNPVVTNSIFWNNTAPEGPEIWIGDSAYPSTLFISFCCVTNGKSGVYKDPGCTLSWGVNMIEKNPEFEDVANYDFHLEFGSPCIDIGNSNAPLLPTNDYDGKIRNFDGDGDSVDKPDLGYTEFTPLHVPANYATIQAALDAAMPQGDMILVNRGVYTENINFLGKTVWVRSLYGSTQTTIDGGALGSVVTFNSGEDKWSILDGFTITNGSAVSGGGILCDGADPKIIGNVITGNSADYGAGVYCTNSEAIISNTIINDNTATYSGGGIASDNGMPIVTNDTIYGNTATDEGGGIYCTNLSTPEVTNTIVWNNTATLGAEISLGDETNPSTLTISYSDVNGDEPGVNVATGCTLAWGDGMIDADPEFVNVAKEDFHIYYTSPCRDAGFAAPPGRPPVDMDQNTRSDYNGIDIGADEFSRFLYITGDLSPEGNIEAKFVGTPGTAQVGLWFGSGIQNPPTKSAFGDFFLAPPYIGPLVLFPIPANGVELIPTRLPAGPGNYMAPMQALIGDTFADVNIMFVD